MKCKKIIVALVCFSAASLYAQTSYTSPNFIAAENEIAVSEENSVLWSTRLCDDLTTWAIHSNAENGEKADALALAWVLSDERGKLGVIKADFYLRLGRFPEEDPSFRYAPQAERADIAAKQAISKCKGLISEDAEDVNLVAGLVADLLEGTEKDSPYSLSNAVEIEESIIRDVWEKIGGGTSPASLTMVQADGQISGNGGGTQYQSKQSSVHGLLVIELSGSEFAGGASKMNATIVPGNRGGNSEYAAFNQEVGDTMKGALKEVSKYMSVRHGELSRSNTVEFSFYERHSIKDGPSAAVACALLFESVVTGDALEEKFAVTGDMSADGLVQPVGGIDGKIRGAIKSRCPYVAIPSKNVKSVADIAILQGAAYLSGIQIFSVSNFDEVLELARHPDSRKAEISEAMQIFDEVAAVVSRPGGDRLLSNPHVQERLLRILELTPNHESARFMQLAGKGRGPKNLSLAGSFLALDRCSEPMLSLDKNRGLNATLPEIKDAIGELRKLRNTLDPRTKPASDALEDLFAGLTEMAENDLSRGSPRYNGIARDIDRAVDDLNRAYDRLRADPEVQEELNY